MRKRLLAGLLLLTACGHGPRVVDIPVNVATVDALRGGYGEVTLSSGGVVYLAEADDLGDALCDGLACVRKADIVGIRRQQNDNEEMPAILMPLAAPAVAGTWLFIWGATCAQQGCGGAAPPQKSASLPEATSSPSPPPETKPAYTPPAFEADRWLRTNQIVANFPGWTPRTNPCRAIVPDHITTDIDALAWVSDNRGQVLDTGCLFEAATALRSLGGPENLDRGIRIYLLAKVRHGWAEAHCAKLGWAERAVPPRQFSQSTLSPFAVLRDILAEESTYTMPADWTKDCRNGPPDPPSTPDRAAFIAAIDPFSPPRVTSWIADRGPQGMY